MSRALIVVTWDGQVTCLSWWDKLGVAGCRVVLWGPFNDGVPENSLVVAELRSVGEAKAFYRTLNDRILLEAKAFDAPEWPSLMPVKQRESSGARK